MNNLKKKLDELVKQSDLFVSTPETIEKLKAQGLPIKSTFTTYEEYLDKLFVERRKLASDLVKKLPHLNHKIANSTLQALYEELKECFVLGIPGAAITLSVIFLELALKYRLYDERIKRDPNSKWECIEQIDFTKAISSLRKLKVISKKGKLQLDRFNLEFRNLYIHYNIKKLMHDMVLGELPSVNIETGDVKVLKNVKPADYPSLWFSAKRVKDKKVIILVVTFCVNWANKLLSKSEE